MVETATRSDLDTTQDREMPRYSTLIAKMANSFLYRHTLGAAVETRMGRVALLAGLPLIWIVALNLGPIYQMLKISFLSNYPVMPGDKSEFTLENYIVFFQEPIFFLPLIRSFVFATATTMVTLIVVYPVAYYVAKVVRPSGRPRALLLLLVPFWAGEIIRTFSVIMLLSNRGAINVLLRDIGLIDRPIPMLYTPFSLGFGLIYLICLYMLLPLYSAIEKIPSSLLDASADLGAGPLTRFRRIILPLSKDGIVSGCALVFLTCIGVFATLMLLGGPNTVLFPETISSFFHGASNKWPVGAAFAMIMLTTALIAAGLFVRLVGGKKGSTF